MSASTRRVAGENYKVNFTCDQGFRFAQKEYKEIVEASCSSDGKWNWGNDSLTQTPSCQSKLIS